MVGNHGQGLAHMMTVSPDTLLVQNYSKVLPAKPTQPLCQFRKDSDHSAATALSAGMRDRHAKQKQSNETDG